MRLLLKQEMLDITASEDEKFDFVIKSAQGTLKFDEIKALIKSRLI